jgi:hypothetical protein
LLGNRKKIAKFLMRTFTCRWTFHYAGKARKKERREQTGKLRPYRAVRRARLANEVVIRKDKIRKRQESTERNVMKYQNRVDRTKGQFHKSSVITE